MPSFIESLRDRILEVRLNELECMGDALSIALHDIVNGEEDQEAIQALLWVSLQQAKGEAITSRGLRLVRLGHCDDQLFTAFTTAMATFAQSPELKQVAKRRLIRRTNNMGDYITDTAVLDIEKTFPETLEPEERQRLEQEAKSHNKSLAEYLRDFAFKLLHENDE